MTQTVFTRQVRSILNDNAGRRWIPAQRSGPALDGGRLALVPTGTDRVFQRPADRRLKDYSVAFYVDASGSMHGEQLDAACAACHALWWGMKQAGCAVSVAAFGDVVVARSEADVVNVTAFRDAVKGSATGSGTQDWRAIQDAEKHFRGQRGGRIVCVLSDGESSEMDQLQAALVSARRAGVVVLAVGIQPAKPMTSVYGERWAADLPEVGQVFTVLAALLAKQYQRG